MEHDDKLGWVVLSLHTTGYIRTNPSHSLCAPYETVSAMNSFGTSMNVVIYPPW